MGSGFRQGYDFPPVTPRCRHLREERPEYEGAVARRDSAVSLAKARAPSKGISAWTLAFARDTIFRIAREDRSSNGIATGNRAAVLGLPGAYSGNFVDCQATMRQVPF